MLNYEVWAKQFFVDVTFLNIDLGFLSRDKGVLKDGKEESAPADVGPAPSASIEEVKD